MAAQLYPTSLADQPSDPYIFDLGHFEDLLKANSERTLVPEERLQIKIVEVGHAGICPSFPILEPAHS